MSSANGVLGMSVERGMKRVGGVCEMFMCTARGGVGGGGGGGFRVDKMIKFGLYQSCENTRSVGRVSVFGLRCCGWCM